MKAVRVTGVALAAILGLAACGGDSEQQEVTEAPQEDVEQSQMPVEDEASDAPTADAEEPMDDGMAAEDPGQPDDGLDGMTYKVGDTFYLSSMDGMGAAEVAYEGFEWVSPERVAGEENYGFAIFSVAAEGDMPVQLPAPIDGGGWHYVTADGEMQSLYTLMQDWSGTWEGRVQHMYSGPFTPGVSESNLLREMIVPERGGNLAHVDSTGMIEVLLEVPDESTEHESPAIDQVYEIADADWGGEVASP